MRAFKIFFLIIVYLIAPLVVCEGFFRAYNFFALTKQAKAAMRFEQEFNNRLHKLWLREKGDPFAPPFLVFTNQNSDDPGRLKKIFDLTRFEPGKVWSTFDFLRDERSAEQSAYQIHINALGFRGRDYAKEKPKGVFRILLLGSYHAFGHGVGDDETYAAQLETMLNQHAKRGMRYEVWNGGRHAGTAIIGLARMKHEIFEYKPDLIILDYGMVDAHAHRDDFLAAVMQFPDTKPFMMLTGLFKALLPILDYSLVFAKYYGKITRAPNEVRYREFQTVMRKMISEASDRGLPVIFIRQAFCVTTPVKFFEELISDRVAFVDAQKAFVEFGKRTQWEFRRRRPQWLDEVEDQAWRTEPRFKLASLRTDFYHLNPTGHKAIAEALSEQVGRFTVNGVTRPGVE